MGVRSQDVVRNNRILRDVVAESFPDSVRDCLGAYFEPAVSALEEVHDGLPSEIAESNPFRSLAKRYLDALLATRRDVARDVILTALRDGASVADIYLCVIAPVQREIGRLWQLGQITVAQEHYCTAATQLNINLIYDHVFAGDRSEKTIVATCVGGELHELPARMLSDFFELAGWNSHYLGANTPTPAILRFIADVKPQVLGISATMAFHLQAVRDLVAEVRRLEAVPDLKILVGGHPFIRDPALCSAVGADGCAPDGPRAVALAESLL